MHEREAFTLDGKAMSATTLADGDLLLEGWAARWTVDREHEAFLPTSFDRGIKSFVNGTAALVWHHEPKSVLGKVLSLERKPDGLWLKARVDGAIRSHPTLGTIYQQIKNGSIRGLSVGGYFSRKLTDKGWVIRDVDLTEVSATATPIGGHDTRFSVIAGKALGDQAGGRFDDLDRRIARVEVMAARQQIRDLRMQVMLDRADLL